MTEREQIIDAFLSLLAMAGQLGQDTSTEEFDRIVDNLAGGLFEAQQKEGFW